MSAVAFSATIDMSPVVLTFEVNPSHPQAESAVHPLIVTELSGLGTPHQVDLGTFGRVDLAWPDECPMSDTDYKDGAANANLRDFVRGVRTAAFTYTDEAGTQHLAHFIAVPPFRKVAAGYAGGLSLYLRT